jgi:hypothetical protein
MKISGMSGKISRLQNNRILSVLTVSASPLISRYIKVKVEHYLLFMFSPPKIS